METKSEKNYCITSDAIIKSYIDVNGEIIPITMPDLFTDRKIIKEFFTDLKSKQINHIECGGDLCIGDEVKVINTIPIWEQNEFTYIAFAEVRKIRGFILMYNDEEHHNLTDYISLHISFERSLLEDELIYSPDNECPENVYHSKEEDKINGVHCAAIWIDDVDAIRYDFTFEDGRIVEIDSEYV